MAPNSEIMSLAVPQELIKPIIETKIKQAVIESFNKDGLVEEMVNGFLTQKVNENGQVSKDNYYNKFSRIDVILGNVLNKSIAEAVEAWTAENKELLKNKINKFLYSKKGQSLMIRAYLDAINKSFESVWQVSVTANMINKIHD